MLWALPKHSEIIFEKLVDMTTLSTMKLKSQEDPPVHFHGGVVHWQPSPFCSCLTLKTKEWPLEL